MRPGGPPFGEVAEDWLRSFAGRDNDNIVHWSEFPDDGHFASLERPEQVIGDLQAFFGAIRDN